MTANTDSDTEGGASSRRSGCLPYWIAGALLVGLPLFCIAPGLLQPPFYLVMGWIPFLARTMEKVTVDGMAVATGATVLLASLLSLHAMGSWLCRDTRSADTARRWRWKWSVAILAAVALLFVTGLATAGLARQVIGLARLPRPLFSSGETARKVECASHMREIGVALLTYAQAHGGRFPARLEDICTRDLIRSPYVFICPSSSDGDGVLQATVEDWAARPSSPGSLSYVYLGHNLDASLPDIADRPVLFERGSNHNGDGMNVLYGDGHVVFEGSPRAELDLCLFNMKQIGKAITRYAQSHGGRFPERLTDLRGPGMIESDTILVCPASAAEPPAGATIQEWYATHGRPEDDSYTYVGGGLTSAIGAPDRRPVLYEPIHRHQPLGGGGGGANILFADGHVLSLSPEEAEAVLSQWMGPTAVPTTMPTGGGQAP